MTNILAGSGPTDIAGLGLAPPDAHGSDALKTGNPVADLLAEIGAVKSPVLKGEMLHALDRHTGGPDATRALAAPKHGQQGDPVSATAKGTTVTYVYADGPKVVKHGNHPKRDNNPLDLETQGGYLARHGAIGTDKDTLGSSATRHCDAFAKVL